jgi:hypothetical protein
VSRALLAAASLALATPPVLVDGPGIRTLPRLGYGARPHVLRGFERFRLRFRLPAGVRQGHGRWYVLRLHVRVEPNLRSLVGRAMIDVETSLRAPCAGAFVHEQRLGDAELVSWQTGGVFGASRPLELAGTAARPVIEGTLTAPCILDSLRGGVNEIDVGQSREGAASFRSLLVFADTGLYMQRGELREPRPRGPFVTIEPLVPARPLRAGARLVLPFRVIRASDVHVSAVVVVRARVLGAARLLAASRRLRLPGGQGALAHGRVVLRALRRGPALLLLAVGDTRVLVAWRVR